MLAWKMQIKAFSRHYRNCTVLSCLFSLWLKAYVRLCKAEIQIQNQCEARINANEQRLDHVIYAVTKSQSQYFRYVHFFSRRRWMRWELGRLHCCENKDSSFVLGMHVRSLSGFICKFLRRPSFTGYRRENNRMNGHFHAQVCLTAESWQKIIIMS